MNERALFDAEELVAKACPVPGCGALRLPGQQGFVPTCHHDLNQEKRPAKCLNHYRNRPEDEIPY